MTATVILLTGPSSAGKTSIGEALRRVLPRPTVFLNGDELDLPDDSEAQRWLRTLDPIAIPALEDQFHSGFYGALVAFAASGLHAVGEALFKKPAHLELFEAASAGATKLLIHVTCDEAILMRRELERGDREVGTAQRTAAQEWVPPRPDLVIDTAHVTAFEAAAAIRDRVT